MKTLIAHLVLTVLFALLLPGSYTQGLSGFAEFGVSLAFFLVLWLTSFLYNPPYVRQFWKGTNLLFFFIREVFLSNLQVIGYIFSRNRNFTPAVLKLPLDLESDAGIVLLANMITLTPGTLTLEVSEDKKYLFYHTVNLPDGDAEKAKRQIKEGFEKRIIAMLK